MSYSINEMQALYWQGAVSEADIVEYLRKWNATPGRLTQAVFADGAIRNFDPEKSRWYTHLYAKFGVREVAS